MYAKHKKDPDPLTALQKDINQLGFQKYIQAKKAKIKADKAKLAKEKEKENNFQDMSNFEERLPSLYQKGGNAPRKYGSVHGDTSSSLIQRIKEFQNRINDLQIQNAIHKKQNQKLIQHVANSKNGSRFFNESHRTREPPPIYQQYQQYPQYPFSPFMSPMMPFQNMNPYASPMNQMNPYQNQPAIQSLKKQKSAVKKTKLTSKFRIAGYVVFFALFFKKYSKSFTLNRFDHFKQNWGDVDRSTLSRHKLCDYFRNKISLKIFEDASVNQLDSLRNFDDKPKKKKKKGSKSKSDESDSNSADSSDLQSEQSSSKDPQKLAKPKSSKVFQFYLKIDIAVSFVIEFIKDVIKAMESEQFEQKNQFLTFFLPMQFQMDRLHEETDLDYLNLHAEKGYSQHDKNLSGYLLIKNIFLTTFVQYSLINQFGKRFFIDNNKISNERNENRVFFSFYIRTTIFKLMVQNYLAKKLQKIKKCTMPKDELKPFVKQTFTDSFMKNKILSFKNNGIDMDEENIQEISRQEMKNRANQLKLILDEVSVSLLKRLLAYRKKYQYQPLIAKTLASQYRTQDNNYFKLHKKTEIDLQRERKFGKTAKSVFESSPTISSDSISIAKIIKDNSKDVKQAKQGKTNKTNKTKKTQKTLKTNKTNNTGESQKTQSNDDSDEDS